MEGKKRVVPGEVCMECTERSKHRTRQNKAQRDMRDALFFLSHLLLQSDQFKKIAHCNTKEVPGRKAEYPKQHTDTDERVIIS